MEKMYDKSDRVLSVSKNENGELSVKVEHEGGRSECRYFEEMSENTLRDMYERFDLKKVYAVHNDKCAWYTMSNEKEYANACEQCESVQDISGWNPFFDSDREKELQQFSTLYSKECSDDTLENNLQMLSEEAAELVQASLKMMRCLGTGPVTPKSREECLDSLLEEAADVKVMLNAVSACLDRAGIMCKKEQNFKIGEVNESKYKRILERKGLADSNNKEV